MEIKNTDIIMIAGNTETMTVTIYNEDNIRVELKEGDIVYMSVKKNINFSLYVLQKTITAFTAEGDAVIILDPEDTSELKGEYVYDIQLNQLVPGENTLIRTLVNPSRFIVEVKITNE